MNDIAYSGSIEFARRLMEGRDLFTHIHESRTAELAVALASRFVKDDDSLALHAQGARIHDIGKMLLPMDLLTKPGKISEHEYRYLQYHVEHGEKLIEPLGLPRELQEIVAMHHERLDGSGYPRGMKGDAIPLHARIAGVADMTEAMLADRPYRRGLALSRVLEIIDDESGRKLDANVVEALHDVVESCDVAWLN